MGRYDVLQIMRQLRHEATIFFSTHILVRNDLAMLAATGQQLTTIIPVVATALWIPIFSIMGILKLNSQEM